MCSEMPRVICRFSSEVQPISDLPASAVAACIASTVPLEQPLAFCARPARERSRPAPERGSEPVWVNTASKFAASAAQHKALSYDVLEAIKRYSNPPICRADPYHDGLMSRI